MRCGVGSSFSCSLLILTSCFVLSLLLIGHFHSSEPRSCPHSRQSDQCWLLLCWLPDRLWCTPGKSQSCPVDGGHLVWNHTVCCGGIHHPRSPSCKCQVLWTDNRWTPGGAVCTWSFSTNTGLLKGVAGEKPELQVAVVQTRPEGDQCWLNSVGVSLLFYLRCPDLLKAFCSAILGSSTSVPEGSPVLFYFSKWKEGRPKSDCCPSACICLHSAEMLVAPWSSTASEATMVWPSPGSSTDQTCTKASVSMDPSTTPMCLPWLVSDSHSSAHFTSLHCCLWCFSPLHSHLFARLYKCSCALTDALSHCRHPVPVDVLAQFQLGHHRPRRRTAQSSH